ncbi:MAG: FecR family protein [Acidobacteriota bacterium]
MRQSTFTAKVPLLVAFSAAVCLAETNFHPSDSAKQAATAKTVQGDVSVLRDLRKWAIDVGDQIKVQETVVTGRDGHALFAVADGSTFEVFPNAKVVFRKNSGNWMDLLDVMLGRVRVQIEHIGNTPNPNRVLTPTAVISVRGTIFDITVNDNNETTVIEVEEGVVDVTHALRGGKRTLTAGESLTVYRDQNIARGPDKGNIARQILRAGMQAVVVATQPGGGIGGGVGGGTGGGGGVGDTPPPSSGPPTTAPPLPPPPPPSLP